MKWISRDQYFSCRSGVSREIVGDETTQWGSVNLCPMRLAVWLRMKHDTKVGGATRGRVIRVIWGYWHDIKNRLPVMSAVAWKVNLWSQLTFLLRTKMVQNKLYGPSRWKKNPIDKVWHWNAYTFIDTSNTPRNWCSFKTKTLLVIIVIRLVNYSYYSVVVF